jgi:hypothetical protein
MLIVRDMYWCIRYFPIASVGRDKSEHKLLIIQFMDRKKITFLSRKWAHMGNKIYLDGEILVAHHKGNMPQVLLPRQDNKWDVCKRWSSHYY